MKPHNPKVTYGGIKPLLGVWLFAFACSVEGQQIYFTSDASGNLVRSYSSSVPALIILRQPTSLVAPPGNTVALSVIAQGAVLLTYQWQFNSNNIPGAMSDSLLLTNITLADFGAYRVIVSNAFGSVTSSNALLQLDSDRDGMADAWETNFFTSITNRSGFQDFDQDSVSDLDEFLEGTNPKNFSSANPRLTIISENGEVFVTPNVPLFTNGQTVTLTGVPDPGQQFLSYIGWGSSGPTYTMRTNPAQLRLGAIGVSGSQMVRAIFGLSIPESLDVTNGWRIDQAGWFGQTNVTHDGVDAVQSARSFDNEQAVLEFTNRMSGEGTISFWWKVDGTPRDELRFVVNNKPRSGAIGTNTDWQLRTYYLPAGTNIIRWIYSKGGNEVSEYNGLYYAPLDAGWVDQVTYAVWPDPSLDSDKDGLPDIWEYKYFDTIGTNPNGDADNDGVSNLDEYLDSTDPSSNASFLPRLTVTTSGGTVVRNPDLPKYTRGETVQLQALPDPDNYFVIWGGAISGTNTTNSVLMNRNQTIIAVFGLPLPVAVDTPTLSWNRSGQLAWFGQTNVSHDGVDAAQAGPITLNQQCRMETTVSGPATLMFWWRSTAQSGLTTFLADGVEQPGRMNGRADWQIQSHSISAGSHTISWVYTNRSSAGSLTDSAWVDQVSLTPGTIPPAIFEHPASTTILQGQQATFAVNAGGTPPLSYQWFRNGTSLGPSGTNPTLSLFVNASDAGSYSARVSNSLGAITSSSATLTVLPIPPTNDNFTNRTAITDPGPVLGYTHGATKEPGEPSHAFTVASRSVWWSWVAPSSANFQLRAVATNLNVPIVAAVYRGHALTALTEVESGIGMVVPTNGMNLSKVAVTFPAVAGTSYAIVVDSVSASAFFTLSVDPADTLVLGNISFNPGRSFGFAFQAPPGVRYEIQGSDDLVNWSTLESGVVPPNGMVSFTDANASRQASRFYRVLILP